MRIGTRAPVNSYIEDRVIGSMLHPAHAFSHPREVLDDPDLTENEKRVVLASWASDACAIEAAPSLRRAPGSTCVVNLDDIFEAMRTLDRRFPPEATTSWAKRQMRRSAIEAYRGARSRRCRSAAHNTQH